MHFSVFFTLSILTFNLSQAQRSYTATLTVSNGGQWGDWEDKEFCPSGYFATGYNMKIEDKQGSFFSEDDTSMNGIRLLCSPKSSDSSSGGYITSGVSPWGYWRGSDKKCSTGNFLVGFILQVEESQGQGDDTAANYISFECRDKNDHSDHYVLNHSMGSGYWGSEGAWSNKCPCGTAICGIRTKIEPSQGSSDDSALNDVKFYCCRF